jgi:hypothetical protein
LDVRYIAAYIVISQMLETLIMSLQRPSRDHDGEDSSVSFRAVRNGARFVSSTRSESRRTESSAVGTS